MARGVASAQAPRDTERYSERLSLSVSPSERDACYGIAALKGLSVSALLREMSVRQAVRLWSRHRQDGAR